MLGPCIIQDRFGEYYQVLTSNSGKPHPAAKECRLDFPESVQSLLKGLRVEESFWQRLLGDKYNANPHCPGRIAYDRLAQSVRRSHVRILKFPGIKAGPFTHDGKGQGYSFFKGPEPLPHARSERVNVRDANHAQQVLAGLKCDEAFWRAVLEKNQLEDSTNRQSTPLQRMQEALVTGELCAYTFPYSPPRAYKEVEYEDITRHLQRPTLGPESSPGSSAPPAAAPQNLDEVATLLADRRRQIMKTGYQQKYSDAQLKEIASTGEVSDRFLVRLIFGDADNAEVGTLGFRRDSGRAPYWATTLDMAEAADTDPEILAGLFGIENFDPAQPFTLAVIDMEKMPPQAERQSFVPTHKKMAEFGEKEFTEDEGFEPGTMTAIMNEEFGGEYSGFMADYESTGNSVYSSRGVKEFAAISIDDANKQKQICSRHKMQLEFGANPLYSGNGLTKVTPDSRYAKDVGQNYGVVETFTFERDPLTIAELTKKGAVKLIPAKPIKG